MRSLRKKAEILDDTGLSSWGMGMASRGDRPDRSKRTLRNDARL